jgi:hypothetical protein
VGLAPTVGLWIRQLPCHTFGNKWFLFLFAIYSFSLVNFISDAEEKFNVSGCVSGVQVRVVRQAFFILKFLAADTGMSSSSCEPNGVWNPNYSCSCFFACTTVLEFTPDNANNFHSATVGSCLWFYWQTLCRYTGREWITLASVLGSFMLAAVLLKCMYTNFVPYTSWPRRCNLSRDKTQHNISILAPEITLLRYFRPVSTIVLWSLAICWPRWMDKSFLSVKTEHDVSQNGWLRLPFISQPVKLLSICMLLVLYTKLPKYCAWAK